MIVDYKDGLDYIFGLKNGTLKVGKGIGNDLDEFFRHKKGDLNVLLGHANVGKTFWILWYFLKLAEIHKEKFIIFSSENSIGNLKLTLIHFYYRKKIQDLTDEEVNKALLFIDLYFKFVDTEKLYSVKSLLELFEKEKDKFNTAFIDPYNSLIKDENDTSNKHDYDYICATNIRMFCKKNQKTIYLSMHTVTDSLRNVYPKGHDYENYIKVPNSGHAEGGGKWENRCDNFIIGHRFRNHPHDWNEMQIHVTKIKDTFTGGKPTFFEKPVIFRYQNYGFEKRNTPQPIDEVQYIKMGNIQRNIEKDEVPF